MKVVTKKYALSPRPSAMMNQRTFFGSALCAYWAPNQPPLRAPAIMTRHCAQKTARPTMKVTTATALITAASRIRSEFIA